MQSSRNGKFASGHLEKLEATLSDLGIPFEREDHEDGTGTDLVLGAGEGDPGLTAKFEFDEYGRWLGYGLWDGRSEFQRHIEGR
jgi:hypothetical protein